MHFLIAVLFLFQAHADGFDLHVLQAIPKPVSVPQFSCDKIEPAKCDQVVTRLQSYGDNIEMHEQGLLDYVSDVQIAASNWYMQLQPLENQTGTVPADYFSVVNQGANDIQAVQTQAAKNHDCMKKELTEILKAAQSCKIPAAH